MKPIDAKAFHNNLKAAVVAHVPLEIGTRAAANAGNLLTVTELTQLEETLGAALANGQLSDLASSSKSEFPARYLAAVTVFHHTGSMSLVLDGLSSRRIALRKAARVLRWAFVYLFIVLLIAFLCLGLFNQNIVPEIESMRADMLLPAAINAPERIDVLHWIPAIVLAFGLSAIAVLIWFLAGGARQATMWLGGRHYVRCRVMVTTLRTMQNLISAGMAVDEAVSVSCDLTGADSTVSRLVRSNVGQPQNAARVATLSNFYSLSANNRLANMKIGAPVALVSLFGGCVVLVYSLVIFWPIIAMLRDLATAGT